MRRVHDEVDINPSGNCAVGRLPFINYLDTASATDNCIENIQHLNGDYPSRAQREVYVNDILISSVRPNLLHNCIVKQKVPNLIASTGYIQVRLKAESSVDPDFLYYYLTAPANVEKYVNVAATAQSSYPSFNKDVIEDLVLPEIDVGIQRRVGRFLSSIDRLIQLSRKRIENLEKLAKEIYDYWFVQFDFPDKNGNPYKSTGGKMVYNPQLKREIPDGWEVVTFGKYVKIGDTQVNPQLLGDAMLEHYSIPAYDDGCYPSFERASTILSNKFKVCPGAFLISKLNPQFKRIWDPLCLGRSAICSTEFIVCISVGASRSLMFEVANSAAFQAFMIKRSSSSTGSRKRIDPEEILAFPFAMPVVKPQWLESFEESTGKLLGMVRESRKTIHELTQLREFLLPLLMNGQAKMS